MKRERHLFFWKDKCSDTFAYSHVKIEQLVVHE